MKDFEENLKRLEEISENIKKDNITIEAAMNYFEEGTRLSQTIQNEINKLEGKIQILMNPDTVTLPASKRKKHKIIEEPNLELFED